MATGDELPTLRELTVEPVVVVPAPVADFTWTPSEPIAGQPVTFKDASSGPPTEWAWTFGDGATSAEENPTHTFAGDGAFGIAVTELTAIGRPEWPAVTMVVFRNYQWGAEKRNSTLWYSDNFVGTELDEGVSYAAIASACARPTSPTIAITALLAT